MLVETKKFGEMEVAPEAVIDMPEGLYGFEQARRFCLFPHRRSQCFHWLQCLDVPTLAFVVINPYDFFADYEVALDDQQASSIGLDEPEDVVILNLVTLGHSPTDATANLVGPIVVNGKTRKAKQVVLANQAYTTKHRLLPDAPAEHRHPWPAGASGEDPCSSLRAAEEKALSSAMRSR